VRVGVSYLVSFIPPSICKYIPVCVAAIVWGLVQVNVYNTLIQGLLQSCYIVPFVSESHHLLFPLCKYIEYYNIVHYAIIICMHASHVLIVVSFC
jgi:hypothetical protein